MELLFNELSTTLFTDKYHASEVIVEFAKTVSAGKRNGFKKVRSYYATSEISLCENYTLENWLNDRDLNKYRDYKDMLFGMITRPFINEEDAELEEKYILTNYYFEDSENGIPKTECVGLAAAYLYETLSISFPTSPAWRKTQLQIIVEAADNIYKAIVHNIFSNASFETQEIIDKVEYYGEITLIESTLTIAQKREKRHISDHHGTDELKNLCDKLELNVYVEDMRSTNWGGSKFIRKIHNTGNIEIVLYKTSKQYALLVKTTGRNYRETKVIADILEEKYS